MISPSNKLYTQQINPTTNIYFKYVYLLDLVNARKTDKKNTTAKILCSIIYLSTENIVKNKRSTPGILQSFNCKK
jgi:hypothetical protein